MKFIEFCNLDEKLIGEKFYSFGRIEVIKQTSGPTLLIINDGTNSFTFKAFDKPGVRAYPQIEIGDIVKVEYEVYKRANTIEGEVSFMKKADKEEKEKFEKQLKELDDKIINDIDFKLSFKSPAYEKMGSKFLEIAKIIRKKILNNHPILIRHNADCDGYSSAVCLERAILKFMDEIKGSDYKTLMYKRAPSKAPFYEYEDCIKDLSQILKDFKRNELKPPLIIITDNGSTKEDLLSIKQMLLYGCEICVIDHHLPTYKEDGKPLIDDYVVCHINPWLCGYDSNISAGMLGYEISNLICKNNSNEIFIPAMAGIIDHCSSFEKDEYIKLAKEKNKDFNENYLKDLGEVIDIFCYYLRFNESREFVDEIFTYSQNQKEIVKMLTKEFSEKYNQRFCVAKKYCEIKDMKNFSFILFDGEKGTTRNFPPIGKSTNFIHKSFEEELNKKIITAVYGKDFITIRVSDGLNNFSVPKFVWHLQNKFVGLGIDGGGHEHAGSLKFVEFLRDEILEEFSIYLKNL